MSHEVCQQLTCIPVQSVARCIATSGVATSLPVDLPFATSSQLGYCG